MNLERTAGVLESSAKGTWQIGEAFWKKESVGTNARCCSLAGRANGTSTGEVVLLFSSPWDLESQGTGHSPLVPCHCGKGSQNSGCIKNENCEASEVAVCPYLLYSVHFWALLFKKNMNQLQAFERATGIKRSGKHHLQELKKMECFYSKEMKDKEPTTRALK